MNLQSIALRYLAFIFLLLMAVPGFAGDSIRPGLELLASESQCSSQAEARLVQALKLPLLQGKDVSQALDLWFRGRLLHIQGHPRQADLAWQRGLASCHDLKPLPKVEWGAFPDATLTIVSTHSPASAKDFLWEVVRWEVSGLTQYGVVIRPLHVRSGDSFPVILYGHGAAFGIPSDFLSWLTDLARRGYVIVAPAMRGEPLFQRRITVNGMHLLCQGEIENLGGEVDDCLSLLSGIWKRPYIKRGVFATVGHSFGAGVALLSALRAGERCQAIVSYDAWLVHPQRYYWDRMARRANNWLSWEDFCNQPVFQQLSGLMHRSAVHHAEHLKAKGLFFIGGAYAGSVFHLSHNDFFHELQRLKIPYIYHVMPHAGHNFVLYTESAAAKKALKIQNDFLDSHYPPFKR